MAQGVKFKGCRHCGRPPAECGPLSARYVCRDCATAIVIENVTSIATKRGDAYERWKAGMRRFAQAL